MIDFILIGKTRSIIRAPDLLITSGSMIELCFMKEKRQHDSAARQSLKLPLLLACLLACQFCVARAQAQSQLLAVEKDGKTGFIDNAGKLVIPFQFDKAMSCHEGVALGVGN